MIPSTSASRTTPGPRLCAPAGAAVARARLRATAKEVRRLSKIFVHSCASERGDREIGKHTSELQSLMRISYAVFCLKKKKKKPQTSYRHTHTTNKAT